MDESLTLQRQAERGREAKRILESDVYQESVARIRENLVAKLIDAPVQDAEGMMLIKLCLGLLDQLNIVIEDTMNTGKMSQIQIDGLRGKNRRNRYRGDYEH